MNRTYAARQLLALGPLSFGQFAEITGWPTKACRRVLSYLVDDTGEAERLGRLYRLTNASNLPDVHPLETERKPGYGQAPRGALRAGAALDVPAAESDVRATQGGCRGCGCCACGMAGEGVIA